MSGQINVRYENTRRGVVLVLGALDSAVGVLVSDVRTLVSNDRFMGTL